MEEELVGPEIAISVPGETVTTQEGVNSFINSNELLAERHPEENYRGRISSCRHTHNKWKWRFVVVLVAALIFIIIVLLVERNKVQNQEHTEQSSGPHPSRFSSNLNANDGTDLRISENSSCVGPSCIACKEDIITHFQPMHCPGSDENVKNGSCFLCGETCLKLDDLLKYVKQNKTYVWCPMPVKLYCCALSIMGNLTHYCGDEGQYLCYKKTAHAYYNQSVDEPVCKCPPGSRSKHCSKPYTQAADCRCFKSSRKFCGQEKITECDDVKINWSTCHMNIPDLDENYNCLCTKSTGNDEHSARCPRPYTESNTVYNGWQSGEQATEHTQRMENGMHIPPFAVTTIVSSSFSDFSRSLFSVNVTQDCQKSSFSYTSREDELQNTPCLVKLKYYDIDKQVGRKKKCRASLCVNQHTVRCQTLQMSWNL